MREEGFEGRVVLIGAEPHAPYERPSLSKEYLRGEVSFQGAMVRPPDYYDESGIETRFGVRGARVEAAGRVVELDGGKRVACDRLLVATGSRNRRVPVPGLDLDGIYDLRTVTDSERIRAEIASGCKAVVVGWDLSARRWLRRSGSVGWKSLLTAARCRCVAFSASRSAG